jgi:hypothetical protein
MATVGRRLLNPLEQWSPIVFMLAGGLALLSSSINTLDAVPGVSTQQGILVFIEGLAGFGGILLSFVAMLGLYPILKKDAPRLARVGVGVMVLPVLFFLVDLVWLSLSGVLGLPSLTLTYLPSPMLALGAVFFLFAVGTTIFGVIALLTDPLIQSIGGLLIVFATAWYLLIGSIAIYGFPIPVWLVALTGLMQGGSMLGIGYFLRNGREGVTQAGAVAG